MSNPTWSYSRIKAFETCPKQFYHLKVKKDFIEPETEAMSYGTAFHLAAEEYIRDNKPLEHRFEYAKPALDALNARRGEKMCELRMGLTASLEPCDFFARDVWWRGVIDLAIIDDEIADVLDYKTSKSARYADTGQLELMALALFKLYPKIKKVRAGLVFVVSRDFVRATYTRDDEMRLWGKWIKKYNRMQKAFEVDTWNPQPSGLCKAHCLVTSCVHNGNRK
jgi:hypothetical protein